MTEKAVVLSVWSYASTCNECSSWRLLMPLGMFCFAQKVLEHCAWLTRITRIDVGPTEEEIGLSHTCMGLSAHACAQYCARGSSARMAAFWH